MSGMGDELRTGRCRAGRGRAGLLLLGLVTMVWVAACFSSPSTSQGAPSSSASPTAFLSADELADAVRFRTTLGLRADEAWIRSVAVDPASEQGRGDYGVPLLPNERAQLLDRNNDPDLGRRVAEYGKAFPETFGGALFDQKSNRILVAAFTDDIKRHQRALKTLMPSVGLEVRRVRWSLADLDDFKSQVEVERDWFPAVGATFVAVSLLVIDNRIAVRYEAADLEVGDAIEEHFANPSWLVAEWDGAPPWQGERGDLVVTVHDSAGAPIDFVWVDFTPEVLGAEEGGDRFEATRENGRVTIADLPAVRYRLVLKRIPFGGEDWKPVAELTVEVKANEQTVVPVTLQR